MADFKKALKFVLENEGGYTNDPADHGGATNFGITMATLSQWRRRPVTTDDVKNLSMDEVALIYKNWYWDKMLLDQVISDLVATILFDQAVNRGVPIVSRQLQFNLGVKVDGIVGPGTLAQLNKMPETSFAMGLAKRCQLSYTGICKKDPTQLVFIDGWISRSQKYFDLIVAN